MKLVIGCVVAALPLLGALQDPPPTEPATEQVAAPSWRINEPAPALEPCEWLQGTTGSGAGSLGAPDIAGSHGSVIVVHTFDSRDVDMIASGLRALKELLSATEDRDVKVVGLVACDDGEAAKRALEHVGLTTPLGVIARERCYFDPLLHGPRAAFVVGRGGELVWKGESILEAKGFCAALKTAIERHAVPALDRELAPELDGALTEYWAGRFAKALEAALKLAAQFADAEGDTAKQIASDAAYLAARIVEHERDLLQRCKQAAAAQSIEALVELDGIFELGFDKPVADTARDALQAIGDQTRYAGRMQDARDWRELERDRPLFFPARNDAEGKKFARKIEAFLRGRPNSTPTTQRAKKLLEQFKLLR